MELAICFRQVGWRAQAALLLLTALALGACGGSGSKPAAAPPSPPPASVLIGGSEAASVSTVLGATGDSPLPSQDVSSSGFLLSRLLVAFKSDATVGQVNAAARAVGATRITSSEPGSLLVVLEVARQTDVAAIQRLAKTLRAQPGIAFAGPGHTSKTSVLPEFTAGIPVSTVGLQHLLSDRFPQAWNARQAMPADCLSRSGSVYVLDQFGPPGARPDFFQQVERSSFFADPNGMSGNNTGSAGHGYDVVSTLAAKFDADTPTGANPFADCLIVHAIEAKDVEYLDAVRRVLHAVAADPDPRVILTSSLNFIDNGFCGINGDLPCDAASVAATLPDFILIALVQRAVIAAEWARLIRTLGIADKVLITQAAGNVDDLPDGFLAQNYLGFRSAALSSPAALATHLHELKALLTDASLWAELTASPANADLAIQPNPSLDPANSIGAANLLIVDSGAGGESPAEVTQSSFDYLGADLRAVGEEVVLGGQAPSGTSYSTPLVAGLASYLWNLAPVLAAQPAATTVELLKRTSATTANSPTVPVVDAYAAVLQLDDVSGCCSGAQFAPVRLGLVDVDGDGGFTGLDLQKFVDAYGLADPNTPTIPSARDFSRFDLNGDGFTGGIITTTFDLDVNGLDANGRANINPTDETVEGYPLTFNEGALSDLQILCYYAYSPLYHLDAGGQNEQLRTALLGPDHCVGAQLNLQFPTQLSSAGTLNAVVEVPVGNGQLARAPNMLVDLTANCATVSPTSAHTDANGAISATVTPTAGCTSVSVDVSVRAGAGTTPLARGTVTATVAQPRVFPGRYEVIAFTILSLTNPPRDIPLVETIGTPFPPVLSLIDPQGLNCNPGPTVYDLSTSTAPAGVDFTGTVTSCGQIIVPKPNLQVRGSWNSASGELHMIFFHGVLPDGGTVDDYDMVLLPCSSPAKPGFIACSSVF